jgi:hypothetical protein
MMKCVLAMCLLVSSASAFAQTDSIYVWNKWCARKDTLLLFDKANNLIQVYSRAFKPTDITVKSLDKGLRIGTPEVSGDTLSVMAMPYGKSGAIRKMRLAVIDNKTRKTLKTLTFCSDSVPKLRATVGNIKSSEALKAMVLTQMSIKPWFPNSLYSYPYSIRQYMFRITTPKGVSTLSMRGHAISQDMQKEIGAAPPGSIVEFTSIKATCPECVTKDLDDIKLKLK